VADLKIVQEELASKRADAMEGLTAMGASSTRQHHYWAGRWDFVDFRLERRGTGAIPIDM
jgi:hypothetical protein